MKGFIALVLFVVLALTYAGVVIHDTTNYYHKDCTVLTTDRAKGIEDTKVYTSDCGTLRITRLTDYLKIEDGNRYDMSINDLTKLPDPIRPYPQVRSLKLSPCN